MAEQQHATTRQLLAAAAILVVETKHLKMSIKHRGSYMINITKQVHLEQTLVLINLALLD